MTDKKVDVPNLVLRLRYCDKRQWFKRDADIYRDTICALEILAADDVSDPKPEREELAPGRAHLTVTGKFQSEKYPWCPAGFVPLEATGPMARPELVRYATKRRAVDREFGNDLIEAINIASASPLDSGISDEGMPEALVPKGWQFVPDHATRDWAQRMLDLDLGPGDVGDWINRALATAETPPEWLMQMLSRILASAHRPREDSSTCPVCT